MKQFFISLRGNYVKLPEMSYSANRAIALSRYTDTEVYRKYNYEHVKILTAKDVLRRFVNVSTPITAYVGQPSTHLPAHYVKIAAGMLPDVVTWDVGDDSVFLSNGGSIDGGIGSGIELATVPLHDAATAPPMYGVLELVTSSSMFPGGRWKLEKIYYPFTPEQEEKDLMPRYGNYSNMLISVGNIDDNLIPEDIENIGNKMFSPRVVYNADYYSPSPTAVRKDLAAQLLCEHFDFWGFMQIRLPQVPNLIYVPGDVIEVKVNIHPTKYIKSKIRSYLIEKGESRIVYNVYFDIATLYADCMGDASKEIPSQFKYFSYETVDNNTYFDVIPVNISENKGYHIIQSTHIGNFVLTRDSVEPDRLSVKLFVTLPNIINDLQAWIKMGYFCNLLEYMFIRVETEMVDSYYNNNEYISPQRNYIVSKGLVYNLSIGGKTTPSRISERILIRNHVLLNGLYANNFIPVIPFMTFIPINTLTHIERLYPNRFTQYYAYFELFGPDTGIIPVNALNLLSSNDGIYSLIANSSCYYTIPIMWHPMHN